MTLSIIVPNVKFARRTQLFNIPALAKNHVFAVFGASREKSLINLNASEPNAVVVGDVAFSAEGARVLGNTNAIRFKGFKVPSSAGCTLMVAFKTGATAGNAGLVNLWSESALGLDGTARRIFTILEGVASYNGVPGSTTPNSNRPLLPNTEYLLSLTRAVESMVSQLRLHNPDGSVALSSPIPAFVGPSMPYAADAVFDIGLSPNGAQQGVYVKGAALWSGVMTEADIAAGASLMYQVTRPT